MAGEVLGANVRQHIIPAHPAGGCQAGQVAQPSHVREVTTPGTVVHRPERLQQLSEGEGSKVD